jgi:hypothetical protein
MMAHTPEPWFSEYDRHHPPMMHPTRVVAAGSDSKYVRPIAHAYLQGEEAPENMRRIVACVNACRGIPTALLERLEMGTLKLVLDDAIELADAMEGEA